tara:strand:+ start:124 stop:474 length:351 start_codon:yes stop_codon:yes gene_type:complete
MPRLPKIFSEDAVNKLIKVIVNKPTYNRRVNTFVSPFKKALVKMFLSQNKFDEPVIIAGDIGEIKLQAVNGKSVKWDKLKANPKDYKYFSRNYLEDKVSYRLTAKEYDVVELKDVA